MMDAFALLLGLFGTRFFSYINLDLSYNNFSPNLLKLFAELFC